jgi:ATP-dependent exoDNAse (exonuclease V) beta subunit
MSLTSPYTPEQSLAIDRRAGNLLLDASAGSGKTTVLVERYVRSVVEDEVPPGRILAITFTEKAAAELRERVRARLWEEGAVEAARAADAGSISTIHGFCARLLRTHALAAGVDPRFGVLDESAARRLGDRAIELALAELAASGAPARDVIAAYGPADLREAILSLHGELRARGQAHPQLPAIGPPPELGPARDELREAAAALSAELGAIAAPAARVREALNRLEGCDGVLDAAEPWPGELGPLALPGGGGAALSTPAGERYAAALEAFRRRCAHRRAVPIRAVLDALLQAFGRHLAALKRSLGVLDFEDLELRAAALVSGDAGVRDQLRERYVRVMVDELQDTNAVQLGLIEAIGDGRLFTVGDAQQAIYGFRHADVELFEALGARREHTGERLTLSVNFRTRPELIEVVNGAFATALGERFRPLQAGRSAELPLQHRAVEMIVADKSGEWEGDGLAAGWRLAEAAALARRVRELIDDGARPREIVVLTRATTDLRAYERALEEASVPTYLIGGRGYWSHPQVLDSVALLRALANPRDEEALLTVLASPMVGLSLAALVIVADGGLEAPDPPEDLPAADRERLLRFRDWFGALRAEVPRRGVPELIERGLRASDYDLAVLRMAGGQRRLANIRKLMRLAREHEGQAGPDLRGFLDTVAGLAVQELGGGGDPRESEAPVEGEALDAVRLMTIHRSKGLEFETVCVADLGRGPARYGQLVRVGTDGRLGIALARPGGGRREPALAHAELGERARERDEDEERRLFYVAVTRARERLILSGAARYDAWERSGGPITWIGPAFCPEVGELARDGGGVGENGVAIIAVRPEPADPPDEALPAPASAPLLPAPPPEPDPVPVADATLPPAPPPTLSYTSLTELERCGYRFYLERVLGLPAVGAAPAASGARGTLLHRLLERLDFRRPVALAARGLPEAAGLDDASIEAVESLAEAFAASSLCRRLAGAARAAREQRFAFPIAGLMITGVFDVLAEESGGRLLVVDYKSDRLASGESPEVRVARAYALQRTIYALAALRTGAPEVEVLHAFLADVENPAGARFTAADRPELERRLSVVCAPVRAGAYRVTEAPHRQICDGCPGAGGLCSWPLAMTQRQGADQLF